MRNNKKRKRIILWSLVASLFIIIITNIGGAESSDGGGIDRKTNEAAAAKEWVPVLTIKGNGDKKSEVFSYDGGKIRLIYDFQGGDFGVFAAYVVKEGDDIMRTGGVPEVMFNGSESGESNLSHLRKGNYYLNVSAANGQWTVTVEQFK